MLIKKKQRKRKSDKNKETNMGSNGSVQGGIMQKNID